MLFVKQGMAAKRRNRRKKWFNSFAFFAPFRGYFTQVHAKERRIVTQGRR
jgi:hypothetical protein